MILIIIIYNEKWSYNVNCCIFFDVKHKIDVPSLIPYLFSGLSQILSFGIAVELVTRVLVKKINRYVNICISFISDRLKHSKNINGPLCCFAQLLLVVWLIRCRWLVRWYDCWIYPLFTVNKLITTLIWKISFVYYHQEYMIQKNTKINTIK